VPAPRAVLIKYPYGAAMGEANAVDQQHAVLRSMFKDGLALGEPGQIHALPYRWRREKFKAQDLGDLEPHAASVSEDRRPKT